MLGFIVWRWWDQGLAQVMAALPEGHARGPAVSVAAALVVALHGAGYAAEGAFYVIWWRIRGARLPFWRFTTWLAVLWLIDLTGETLGGISLQHPAVAPWLAPLAGIGLLAPGLHPRDGLGAAFAGFGLLTLARIAATAVLQARTLGRDLREPLAVTTLAWLATRLAVGLGLDLLRGMSPLP
jgi:hypothetical protein